jgi:7-cyano-7-deazaguanine synthase
MTARPAAVVLLSGGLDSATTLAMARAEGYRCHALSFRYGQRHVRELLAARRVASAMGVPWSVVRFDLRSFGGSALTAPIAVPKGRSRAQMERGIPVTYVPARNAIFLSFALARAETLRTGHVFIGVNVLDSSGYPDCRPEFVRAFERMANLATKAAVEGACRVLLHTPLIRLSKADIVREAVRRGVPLHLTWSCYDPAPRGRACGRCDACQLRLEGFRRAGVPDPVRYAGR